MENELQTIKTEQSDSSHGEYQIKIDNHRKAANHHQEAAKIQLDSENELQERRLQGSHKRAAKHHLDAANFHEAGEHTKASDSTIKAHFFASLASEISNENIYSNTINR